MLLTNIISIWFPYKLHLDPDPFKIITTGKNIKIHFNKIVNIIVNFRSWLSFIILFYLVDPFLSFPAWKSPGSFTSASLVKIEL